MARRAEEEVAKLPKFHREKKAVPSPRRERAPWKLPDLKTEDLGKLGPGLGLGIGCGVGVGAGVFGAGGLGTGLPGLRLGVGVGAGCGIGFGFGYGIGKGGAFDGEKKYTNVGKLFQCNLPSADRVCAFVEGVALNTKKLVVATSRRLENWTIVDDQVKK